jgi:hypothetical protein
MNMLRDRSASGLSARGSITGDAAGLAASTIMHRKGTIQLQFNEEILFLTRRNFRGTYYRIP